MADERRADAPERAVVLEQVRFVDDGEVEGVLVVLGGPRPLHDVADHRRLVVGAALLELHRVDEPGRQRAEVAGVELLLELARVLLRHLQDAEAQEVVGRHVGKERARLRCREVHGVLDRGLEPVAVHDDVERPVAALGALGRLLRVEREPRLQLLAGGARVDEHVAAGAADVRDPLVQHLCGNQPLTTSATGARAVKF